MKRLLSLTLIALLALSVLTACNSDAPSSSTPSSSTPSSETPSSSEPDPTPEPEPEPEPEETAPELSVPTGSGNTEVRIDGYGGQIVVNVTVEDDTITELDVNAKFETADIGVPAAEAVAEAILEANSPDVDAVAGATVTSDAVMKAVRQALAEIAGQ